ncbi:S8 family serine peptidase [Gluconacetobacter asukensis]|uniref:S8 family serine peptidase n=2 Tax=Gluconacetobacter asukensis TaxID=1017181 RepID=A0A7W4P0M7_9PROT|nr:S8 family serine peptidase [Gluconacetobacter asukensis]
MLPNMPAASREVATNARQILVMLRIPPDHHRPSASYGGDYADAFTIAAQRRRAEDIAHRYGLAFVGNGWQMPLLGVDCYVMQVGPGDTVETAIKRISDDSNVLWSQAMHLYRAEASPSPIVNDPLADLQPVTTAWNLTALHRVATGRGVVVAVVDSRVQLDHPDLAGQFVSSENFVDTDNGPAETHGTGVAGVIAAKAGNAIGIAGVAPRAKLMALRACWQTDATKQTAPTVCDSLSLAKALQYAIEHSADVINLSLSGPPDRLLANLIDIAAHRGIVIVAAYDPTLPQGGFPASAPDVIPVDIDSASTAPSGVYLAPGEDVPTTQPGGQWALAHGSSYAAAHVSGLVALLREDRKNAPVALLATPRLTGGVIDACATLLHAGKPCDCDCPIHAHAIMAGR